MGLPAYQVNATAKTTHDMLVAIVIFTGVGFLAVILAGESKTVGNSIAGVLGIMLFTQGVMHINPLASFLANHSLMPKHEPTGNVGGLLGTIPTKSAKSSSNGTGGINTSAYNQ